MARSAGKVMVTVFREADGVLPVDFLVQRRAINGEYYASLLEQLRVTIMEKRRGKMSKGVRLLQDSGPAQKGGVAISKAASCRLQVAAAAALFSGPCIIRLPPPPKHEETAPRSRHRRQRDDGSCSECMCETRSKSICSRRARRLSQSAVRNVFVLTATM